MASDDIRVDSVEVVHRLDNVWVHFHLAADLPEESGATIVVEAEARDGATRLVGVTLNHPQPSELFVAVDDDERAVVSVGTEHVTGSLLTVAFPPDAFADLGADPLFTVRVERDDEHHDIDAPVTVTDPPLAD
jgi:hypothetical protein